MSAQKSQKSKVLSHKLTQPKEKISLITISFLFTFTDIDMIVQQLKCDYLPDYLKQFL